MLQNGELKRPEIKWIDQSHADTKWQELQYKLPSACTESLFLGPIPKGHTIPKTQTPG